jgi:hypothetical protein
MYEINLDNTNKRIIITFAGFMNEVEGDKFFNEYNQEIRKISSKDYSLVLNIEEMKAIEQKNLPKMKESFNLYKAAGFKKMFALKPKSVITSMQLKRVLNELNYTIIPINNLCEAE